jgi:hemerythrin-like domain-containing protein
VCEYCGCQSLRSIAELTDEHTAALDLIDNARRAAVAGLASDTARAAAALLALLEPHTAVEEEALFPAMAREHPEHVAVLSAEHARIHAALERAFVDGPASTQDLLEALQLLREHIFKEQDGLFPAALIELDPPDWERLEAVRHRVGSTLPPARTR